MPEIIPISGAAISDEERKALHEVIAELDEYVRRAAPSPEAMNLLLHAKRIVGVSTR